MPVLAIMAALGVVELCAAHPVAKSSQDAQNILQYDFPFESRSHWKARPAKQITPLSVPVPYVVIHHSYTPAACYNDADCCKAMREMQDFHMDDRKWWDVGYNFGVGSNGVAYEGRGWKILGAHALHFNNVSIGICLIGDWRNSVPPADQLETAKALIAAGVELGYIRQDYKLVGHRQVRDTECPGDALFEEIQHWAHYSPYPKSARDLLDIKEISESVKEIIRDGYRKQESNKSSKY